jgi:hypothetical protein
MKIDGIPNRYRKNLMGTKKFSSSRGISLYLTLIFLAVLLSISLGLSVILISQISVIREMADSVVAFYAADTGIERELYPPESNPEDTPYSGFLDLDDPPDGTPAGTCPSGLSSDPDDCCYRVEVFNRGDAFPEGGTCEAPNRCIRAIGVFRQTRRAIEVKK